MSELHASSSFTADCGDLRIIMTLSSVEISSLSPGSMSNLRLLVAGRTICHLLLSFASGMSDLSFALL